MTLRKSINKKGGSEYASVSDNYNLLENALNQIKTKGGCSSYADVNSSYMITDIKKGGNKKYKKGGNFDLLSTGKDLLSRSNSLFGNNFQSQEPAKAQAPEQESVTAQAPTSQKGGTRKYKKGGNIDLLSTGKDLLTQTTNLLNNTGGCGCSTKSMKKGGAIELAPFAAAVALLAARYMTDIDEMKPTLSSKSVSKKVSKPKSKSSIKK
jgi:hypothetical protein